MPDHTHAPAVAVAPVDAESAITETVQAAGGRIVPPEQARALIWTGGDQTQLERVLQTNPGIRWVQLPSAGIERYTSILDPHRTWTCAKGIYAAAVAEHALALALAGTHRLPELARLQSWRPVDYPDLHGGTVTIVGGGGIARALLDLLRPFRVRVTVVRRHPDPLEGADRVLPVSSLMEALHDADVVVLAPALTPETDGMIAVPQLRAMKHIAWLVNVGRGRLVVTDDLVTALRDRWIGGAALDVTDPEPLPDGHPLWTLDNCLITPHCANPPSAAHAQYVELVGDNVRRFRLGEPLRGLVDVELGY